MMLYTESHPIESHKPKVSLYLHKTDNYFRMRRQREDMQVNMAGLRRHIINIAHNYSSAQVLVREATSNDPWGPSSRQMAEIADLTYNVVAFTEIMQMLWKRLNSDGRYWRHVYKSLLVLEYCIKTGSEKVAQQCKENIFCIQTLQDFQYTEDVKDLGKNVREKAKSLIALLKDDERLRNERARALKAKERSAQNASAFGSDGGDTPTSPPYLYGGSWAPPPSEMEAAARGVGSELECARPQTVGEEELQLQLALAMSREEAEQEEQRRRSDDVRLQLALSQSEDEFKNIPGGGPAPRQAEKQSHLLDLLDVNLSPVAGPSSAGAVGGASSVDPWGMPAQPVPPRPQMDPWGVPQPSSSASPSTVLGATALAPPVAHDPWAPLEITPSKPVAAVDPWKAVSSVNTSPPKVAAVDPWSPSSVSVSSDLVSTSNNLHSPASDLDEFDIITNRERPGGNQATNINTTNNNSTDSLDLSALGDALSDTKQGTKKSPHSFLGENSSLVNLDNLVTVSPKPAAAPATQGAFGTVNPFSSGPTVAATVGTTNNLFQQQAVAQAVRPTINQIRQQPFGSGGTPQPTSGFNLPQPLQPNPFLS
ncbi:Epsin-2 [Frankliniella fusca]|uniref:Epsin-2 n=1 Tax=Frankliniella fusca TaxID=407009 RepID=A0AAE1H1P9_9NEOP|nr:Epsin-2 [Frankliniella fusca]